MLKFSESPRPDSSQFVKLCPWLPETLSSQVIPSVSYSSKSFDLGYELPSVSVVGHALPCAILYHCLNSLADGAHAIMSRYPYMPISPFLLTSNVVVRLRQCPLRDAEWNRVKGLPNR